MLRLLRDKTRVQRAREAYLNGDLETHKMLHSSEEIGKEPWHKTEQGKYIGQAVYGASDGIVTTFAAISGVAGANLSPKVALIVGLANLFADGISMAIGDYLSEKSQKDYIKAEKEREQWEIENMPEAERYEIREIYKRKGLSGEKLNNLVDAITSNKDLWIETMLHEELGLFEDDTSPLKSALVTFFSFIIAGFMPLIAYVFASQWYFLAQNQFLISCIITGITLFVVGALRQIVTGVKWFVGGFEMLMIGGLSAFVAYIIGWLLKTVFNIVV
ncbi:MAG: VIT1/CCC1 transporter family protein [Fervidobacterium sp.]|nr:VIT1/CCC1 transporter family protein [Fervidobacterium sp.]